MCGIFGAVSLQGAPLKHPGCLAAMAAALAHRGPDGERIVGHERAALGARRLAIMDLTTGDQPFQNPARSIWMVCNGEIYNAPELRREETLAGYPFRSTGDIETIVPSGPGSTGSCGSPPRSRRCSSIPTSPGASTRSRNRSTRRSATCPRRTRCSPGSRSSLRHTSS